MIKEKTVYEVNGKTFTDKAEALKEDKAMNANKVQEVADKFLQILNTLKEMSAINSNPNLVSVYLDVEDNDLKPRWFEERKYSVVFTLFLKSLNISYNSFGGDERKNAYLRVAINNKPIENIPHKNEVVQFIETTLIEQEKKQKEYLESLR